METYKILSLSALFESIRSKRSLMKAKKISTIKVI